MVTVTQEDRSEGRSPINTAGHYGGVGEQHAAGVRLKLPQLVTDVVQQLRRAAELLQLQRLGDAVRLVAAAARKLSPA